MTSAEPDGILPVDKPVGPTSHDIVAAARRALGTRRVGHTGTLDPFASGLLLLCAGPATRLAEFLTGQSKRYAARVRLGETTDTDDPTGAVTSTSESWRKLERADVEAGLRRFRGDIMQVPSMYSAKRRGGVRAHAAAREGTPLTLEAVPVRISELRLIEWEPPELTLEIECSSGTYIRAVARDLGAALGSGAHLVALRRTGVGRHRVEDALTPDQLHDPERVARAWIRPLDALEDLPRIDVGGDELAAIRHGRALRRPHPPGTVVLAAHGGLAAIGNADGTWIRPRKVFIA